MSSLLPRLTFSWILIHVNIRKTTAYVEITLKRFVIYQKKNEIDINWAISKGPYGQIKVVLHVDSLQDIFVRNSWVHFIQNKSITSLEIISQKSSLFDFCKNHSKFPLNLSAPCFALLNKILFTQIRGDQSRSNHVCSQYVDVLVTRKGICDSTHVWGNHAIPNYIHRIRRINILSQNILSND